MYKTVITTVGTSLITNFLSTEDGTSFKTDYDDLKNISFYEALQDLEKRVVEKKLIKAATLKKNIKSYVESEGKKASAETNSVFKIRDKNKENEHLIVYLICTDTLLSPLCAEVIAEYLSKEGFEVKFEKAEEGKSILDQMLSIESFESNHIVKGLRVDLANNFDEAFGKLIKAIDTSIEGIYPEYELKNRLLSIGNGNSQYFKEEMKTVREKELGEESPLFNHKIFQIWQNKDDRPFKQYFEEVIIPLINELPSISFNITGGFKATIPVMTLMAQLYKVPIVYLYEEKGSEAIQIDPLPFSFEAHYAYEFLHPLGNDDLSKLTPAQRQLLLQNKLIVEEKNKPDRLSTLGYLMKKYAEKLETKNLTSGRAFGRVIEHVILAFYLKERKECQDIYPTENDYPVVLPGVKPKKPKKKDFPEQYLDIYEKLNSNEDIDLEFSHPDRKDIIACEIKSLSEAITTFQKIIDTAWRRVNLYKVIGKQEVKEYWLMVYLKEGYESIDDLKYTEELKTQIEERLGVTFKIWYVNYPIGSKEPYEEIMKNGIKKEKPPVEYFPTTPELVTPPEEETKIDNSESEKE